MAVTVQITDLVYQPITSGLAAVHDRILDAAAARIALLALDGIQEVVRHKIPSKIRLTLPCVLLTSYLKSEQANEITTGHDDTVYPVYVLFLSRNPEDHTDEARLMLWRQKVSRAFRYQRLPGVLEAYTCRVEYDPVVEVDPGSYEYQFSAMTLQFTCREPRGFGA